MLEDILPNVKSSGSAGTLEGKKLRVVIVEVRQVEEVHALVVIYIVILTKK